MGKNPINSCGWTVPNASSMPISMLKCASHGSAWEAWPKCFARPFLRLSFPRHAQLFSWLQIFTSPSRDRPVFPLVRFTQKKKPIRDLEVYPISRHGFHQSDRKASVQLVSLSEANFLRTRAHRRHRYISMVAAACMVLYGYDASVFNTCQNSKNWVAFFGNPVCRPFQNSSLLIPC